MEDINIIPDIVYYNKKQIISDNGTGSGSMSAPSCFTCEKINDKSIKYIRSDLVKNEIQKLIDRLESVLEDFE